ncbi:MAG: response regulator [Lachnospiraceae bacterium]|nr:response regulator [Lachnospiraceae bacterium]
MTGEKESFLIRVLSKKITDNQIDCEFVPWRVNDLNDKWQDVSLFIVYMEEGDRPPDDVWHFMVDKMSDEGGQMFLIGEKSDVDIVVGSTPGELIGRFFYRPVNNDNFVSAVIEYIRKEEAGGEKKSILIVDDDPGYLGVVREWLKGTYKVSMATSGVKAISWLAKHKVDLILLDHEMPVTSGPKVLEMLRSDEDTRSIPVMFLTGRGDKESVMKVLSLKPEGYFLKTIEKKELLQNLEEFFRTH